MIVEALAQLRSRSCIIDGEAVSCGDGGVPSFDRIRYRRYDADVFLYAFDLIELNGAVAPHSGLGWQMDHFLGYLGLTFMVCLAWPRALVVGVALAVFAFLLENLQALLPDRSFLFRGGFVQRGRGAHGGSGC